LSGDAGLLAAPGLLLFFVGGIASWLDEIRCPEACLEIEICCLVNRLDVAPWPLGRMCLGRDVDHGHLHRALVVGVWRTTEERHRRARCVAPAGRTGV